MGFHYTKRVFDLVRDTTSTEQLLLALLAHMANDKTGMCFPAINTLAEKSRLSRSAVIRSLDSLRRKGYIDWKAREGRKPNQVLSNLYTLTLPVQPSDADELSVAASDTPGSPQPPPQSPTATPPVAHSHSPSSPQLPPQSLTATPPVAHSDPNIKGTDKYHPGKRTEKEGAPQGASGSASGGFTPRRIGEDGALDSLLRDFEPPPDGEGPSVVQSVVDLAMKAVGSASAEDKRTFSQIMLWRNADACREVIYQFASERKANEFSKIKNLAALLKRRLMVLPNACRQDGEDLR